jgi:hypothetical protein
MIEYYIYQNFIRSMILERRTPHMIMMIGSAILNLHEVTQTVHGDPRWKSIRCLYVFMSCIS